MLEVIGGSLLVCSLVFICLSGLGYMTFGDSVDSDLLLSYPETKAVILARFALVYVVALSYPVLLSSTIQRGLSRGCAHLRPR